MADFVRVQGLGLAFPPAKTPHKKSSSGEFMGLSSEILAVWHSSYPVSLQV